MLMKQYVIFEEALIFQMHRILSMLNRLLQAGWWVPYITGYSLQHVWNNSKSQLWVLIFFLWIMGCDSWSTEVIEKPSFYLEISLLLPEPCREPLFYSPASSSYCSALGTYFSSLFMFWISDKLTARPGSSLAPGSSFFSFSSSVEAGAFCKKDTSDLPAAIAISWTWA